MSFVWCIEEGKLRGDKPWHLMDASERNQIQVVAEIKTDTSALCVFFSVIKTEM